MATRRKKASTRVRAGQRAARPKRGARAERLEPRKKRVIPPKKRVIRRSVGRVKATKKRLPAKKAKSKRSKRNKPLKKPTKQTKPRKPKKKGLHKSKETFHKLRKVALKKNKLVLPLFPRKKGRTPLRGTSKNSQQRDIIVRQFWPDVNDGLLEEQAMRAYHSMFKTFPISTPPTMYGRLTFTVTGVKREMNMGSPPVLKALKKKAANWFIKTSLAYTLEGARYNLQKTFDDVGMEIAETIGEESPLGEFFLEYLTVVAYTL